MRVAGIDASSRAIDIVLLDEDTNQGKHHRFELDGDTAINRARSVNWHLPTGSFWDDVYLVGIEESYSVTFRAAVAQALVRGAVAARLPATIGFIPIPPNEWQRLFLGLEPDEKLPRDRKQRKKLIRRRAVELGFGDAPDLPQDAYDAYGIAHAVRTLNRQAIERSAA